MPSLEKFRVMNTWFHSSGDDVDTRAQVKGYVDFFPKYIDFRHLPYTIVVGTFFSRKCHIRLSFRRDMSDNSNELFIIIILLPNMISKPIFL